MALRSSDGIPPPATIAVIGMGRLGGRELGYGSDADVLFVCEPRDGVSDAEAVRYASGIAEAVRRLLAAPSQDPPLQVDTDLRPEGRNGPLARTLDSYRAYYAQWSEVWEAQALLRASAVAGDEDLGRRFCEMVDPVRYPVGGLKPAMVREVRRIKARVDAERLPRGADPTTHAKLGRAGSQTSSGRCNCSSSSTRVTGRGCARRRRSTAWRWPRSWNSSAWPTRRR